MAKMGNTLTKTSP